jgi:NAD(P)-dependent dehydrogenase (short-subunit alcohol dehydrogenase family)
VDEGSSIPIGMTDSRKTLILTGASRGIGHATVKRFSTAGWRVITCSRHPFPEDCPWDAGPEDHIVVDLASSVDTTKAIAVMRIRTRRKAGCAGEQCGDQPEACGWRADEFH